MLESSAKLLAPVDTGVLRASIFKKIIRKALRITGIVGSNMSYAPAQELGTKHMQAANSGEGYFRPAAERSRSKIGAIFGKHMRSGLRSN